MLSPDMARFLANATEEEFEEFRARNRARDRDGARALLRRVLDAADVRIEAKLAHLRTEVSGGAQS